MAGNLLKQRRINALSEAFAILVITAILIVVNLIVVRHDFQKDLTSNKRFTLADQTHQLLKNLNEPIMGYSFFRETDEDYATVKDLLKQYRTASRKFEFRFVDLDREPMLAKKYDVTSYQTIVLEQNNRFRKVVEPTEHALTNTLVRLTRGDVQKNIYFTRGNGELDPDSVENNGLGFLKMSLNDVNYNTQSLNLLTVKKVPDDCDVLAVVGPLTDPTTEVKEMILQYVNDGGRLFIALEPGSGNSFRELLENFSINASNNIVIDPNGFKNIFQPIVEIFPPHVITDNFDFGLVFRVASTISTSSRQIPGWISSNLCMTGSETWIETNLDAIEKKEIVFDPELHQKSSVAIAAAAQSIPSSDEPDAEIGRVVAIGDADFTGNIFFQTFAAHEPFIMNVFHWLSDEKDLIAIPPKAHFSQPLLLQDTQLLVGFVVPIVIIPLIIALFGTVRIIVRRRKS
ncbi:GldG family protein [bacterium]|nr:GldG family protein [bacterium]